MKTLKRCACGRVHNLSGWLALPLVGRQPTVGGQGLELRNCACGSTISVDVLTVERARQARVVEAVDELRAAVLRRVG